MGDDFFLGEAGGGGYIGLLSFFSFAFSVIAAVLAIDLYALLRTGRSGGTWRVLIIASVMFALMHALRLAEILRFGSFAIAHLSEIVELMFVMALAYAFYLQRKAFGNQRDTPATSPKPARRPEEAPTRPEIVGDVDEPDTLVHAMDREPAERDEDLDADSDEDNASEWARLNGQAEAPARRRS